MILCIVFITASELSFSRRHILTAHGISFLAGVSILAFLGSLTWAILSSFILIALPVLVGCYGLELHAHNSIAFRLLNEIDRSEGIRMDELLRVHSSQELRVQRRVDQLILRRYVIRVGEIIYPTKKGLRVSKLVQFSRLLLGSFRLDNPPDLEPSIETESLPETLSDSDLSVCVGRYLKHVGPKERSG